MNFFLKASAAFTLLLLWCCQSPDRNTAADKVPPPRNQKTETITSFAQWFKDPIPLVSAHRGGPYPGYPENAIETFQKIVDHTPTIIECDISMTKDSVLVLMHDKTLDRTTNGSGNVIDQLYDDIRNLFLIDNEGDTTLFKVPTLDEALAWGKGRALFTLDVKRGVPYEKVIASVESFEAASYAAIITYRIQDAIRIHSLNPEVLISVSARDQGALEQIEKSEIPFKNLLGFVGTREPERAHYEKLKELELKTILGTLGNLDKSAAAKGDDNVYLTYIKNGANIIATDRPLEVARVLKSNYPNYPNNVK